jgi:hypothetical protein
MSSPRFYHSRLFNLLNRRRQIKWRAVPRLAVQILLYPIYLFFQLGRNWISQARQLPPAVEIETMLELPSDSLFACDLQTRQLVISKKGQIIPLSNSESQIVKRHIYQEIVAYHQRKRKPSMAEKLTRAFAAKSPFQIRYVIFSLLESIAQSPKKPEMLDFQQEQWLKLDDLYSDCSQITLIDSKEHIDTQAVNLGYIDHPVLKHLGPLDRLIAKLENLLLFPLRLLAKLIRNLFANFN